MQQKSRIEWIDCLRGLTMILVIYHHMMTPDRLMVRGDAPLHASSSIVHFFNLVIMPLFFFVSGFIAYNGGGVYNPLLA